MSIAAALLVIPDALLAMAWMRLTRRRRWLAAWFASWTASVIAVAAMILYALAGVWPGTVVAGGVAAGFAVGRFLWTPFGPRFETHTGRHHYDRG